MRFPALLGLLGPVAAFFTAFFIVPAAVIAVASFTDANGHFTFAQYARILLDGYHWDILLVTFRLALLTTVICALLGCPLAYYLVRIVRWRPWRRLCVIVLVVPLFTSNIVRAFGWMVMLGHNGLVNQSLISAGLVERPIHFLGTETAIIIGLVYILLPFMVLAAGNSLAKADPALEQASADLGARPAVTFLTVTLPLCLPGVTAGAIMVFTLALSAYVSPALLSGGRVTVFPMLIFQQYTSVFDPHYGGALSVTLLVLTLALVAIANHFGNPGRHAR